MNIPNAQPEIVPHEDWLAALAALQQKEKALTAMQDELAAERRRMPRERVTKTYRFNTPTGPATLHDLFDSRRQLIVYHHMLKSDDTEPCPGCCMVGDQIPHLAHLHARDTSLVFVARAPIEEIDAFKKRMRWTMPWFSTGESFNSDFGVTTGFGLNVFLRDGDAILRTYYTTGRGAEMLGTPWAFLDLTPFGRQETWEVSPPGTPQSEPYQWWRLHDQYPDQS
ncbi:MAG: DUF899 domain-containing protein [Pseudomonadota bacterium]